jgi:hypothetical protein
MLFEVRNEFAGGKCSLPLKHMCSMKCAEASLGIRFVERPGADVHHQRHLAGWIVMFAINPRNAIIKFTGEIARIARQRLRAQVMWQQEDRCKGAEPQREILLTFHGKLEIRLKAR